ncbi:MAG TPA: hypothetical protein DHU26_07300, partial [Spirochaetaceae bacterium]|nr:hypothetical protein [Spirochaetaceae bacterium]
MKKLLIVSLAVLLMTSVFVVGAQTNKTASIKPVKVAVVFFDFSNTYLSYMRGGMKAFESSLGPNVSVEYFDSRNDQPTQNDQIDTLIARGFDVIA